MSLAFKTVTNPCCRLLPGGGGGGGGRAGGRSRGAIAAAPVAAAAAGAGAAELAFIFGGSEMRGELSAVLYRFLLRCLFDGVQDETCGLVC